MPRSARSASARRASSYARVTVRPGRRERARHEPLRPGRAVVASERERGEVAALAHRDAPPEPARPPRPQAARALRRATGSPGSGTMSFAATTTRTPRRLASSTTTSTAAALSSTRKTSASAAARSSCRRTRSARLPGHRGDASAVRGLEVLCEPRVRLGRRRAEERDALAVDRLERPRPQHGADHERRPRPHVSAKRVAQLRVGRVVLGHRDDDEIGDPGAVGVQVAGGDLDRLRGGRDEHPAVGGDGRQRGPAAVEDDELRPEPGREPTRPRGRSRRRRRRPARRRSGGSPPS